MMLLLVHLTLHSTRLTYNRCAMEERVDPS
jgi:hypothetical protein